MIFLKIHTGKSEIPCEDNNTWLSVDRFHPMPTRKKLILIIFLIVMVELQLILFILTQGAIDIHYFSSVEAA